jgi:ferredoxin-NADP reductase
MVATRMRDTAFKRVLRAMPLGTTVKIESPFGTLILQNNAARVVVLLAGGIGITPFRSMLFHAANATLSHRIFLFYSNRRPEDAPFLDELQALEGKNQHYTLIVTMTEMEKSHRPRHGEMGQISKEILSRYLKDTLSPSYYIAGPPDGEGSPYDAH